MNKFFAALTGAMIFWSLQAAAYEEKEYLKRPWEIIRGLQPHSKFLWDTDTVGLKDWTISSNGKLSVYNKTKLWGENVTKVDLPARGSVTIRFKKPFVINAGDGNGLDLWMFGPLGRPKLDFVIIDAQNKTYRVPTSGLGSNWASERWWGMTAALLPEQAKYPVRVTAITLSNLNGRIKNDFLCIDRLGVYQEKPVRMADSRKTKNPFPVTEDGIMPIGMQEGAKNSVSQSNNSYRFAYQGKDAQIVYTYTPQSGTLSDLSVTINGKTFQPAVDGGIRAQLGNVKFLPFDINKKAVLLKKEFDGKRLSTVWQWEKNNVEFKFELNFWIKGKSLAVETRALTDGGLAFDCGKTVNTPNPRLFALTYLHNRWSYPHFLATDDYFVSVLLDWYSSEASSLLEGLTRYGIDGAQVYDKNSAKLMGGSHYMPLTNGKRNRIYEKMYITVSPELYDVMPHIANPPSKFLQETANLVCCTRCYPLQGDPKHCDGELALWDKLYAYGVTDTYVRTHIGLLRTPIKSNNIAYQIEGSYYNGGDATVQKLSSGMRKYVKHLGFYGNNRVISPFNDKVYFQYGALLKNNDNTYAPGCRNIFRPKSSVQLEHQKHYVPALRKKFPALNGQYLDELNNAPPWADTDYDHKAPGCGTFAAVLRDYGLVAMQQKELFNAPIWSEGCAAYFWAGLMDINYAVSNDTQAGLPLIVDFKLTRLNKLSSYTGADWPILHGFDIDKLLANEIACGNIGHLGRTGERSMIWQGESSRMKNFAPVLKSYFMIRQVQEYYAGLVAASIKYEINGRMMTASEMLKGNFKPSGRIHTVYPTGLQTWVNHNKDGNWVVNVDGEEFTLPPYGHVAIVPDELMQYIAIKEGHTVSYSRGKYYTYVDGRGQITEFPEITCSNAYVFRQINGKTRITPAPFRSAETVKGLSYVKATALKQDGSKQGNTFSLDVTDAGMGDLVIDGKAFHYEME